MVDAGCRLQVQSPESGSDSDSGSGPGSGSGWRGRWMEKKAKTDGQMWMDGPSALNCIKWKDGRDTQELVRQFRFVAGTRRAGRRGQASGE